MENNIKKVCKLLHSHFCIIEKLFIKAKPGFEFIVQGKRTDFICGLDFSEFFSRTEWEKKSQRNFI
jgi:hypothetical protein